MSPIGILAKFNTEFSTIDSFLGEVLAPHIDLVALHLSRDQLPDEQAPLLRTQALNAAWRIRNARDGFEAGNADKIFEST